MTRRDMGKATLGQSRNRISRIPSVALGFEHSCISESRGRSRDAIHPTIEIGTISRERISCRHDQPANINHMEY